MGGRFGLLSARTVALTLVGVLGLAGGSAVCAQTPPPAKPPTPAAKPPPEDPEIAIGKKAHEDMLKSGLKLITDPAQVGRVEAIGKKLAEVANKTLIHATYGGDNKTPYDYKFFVVDDKDVNAFSIPGGYIYVNKGLLDNVQSNDELAGVLGHEIMHAAHHHGLRLQKEQGRVDLAIALSALAAIVAKVPTNDTGNLLMGAQLVAIQKINGYSQEAERDADHGGVILAQQGGFNPVGALTFMERLGRDQKKKQDIDYGIYRTHPPEAQRAAAMIAQITALGRPINRRETSNYLKVTTRVTSGVNEVLVDDKIFFRTGSADKAKAIAAKLNVALDEPVQIYDVRQKGPTIFVRDEPMVTADMTDATAAQVKTPEALAEQGWKALRNVLYKYVLDGVI